MKKPYIYLEIVFYQILAASLIVSLIHLINNSYTSISLRVLGIFQCLRLQLLFYIKIKMGKIYVPKKVVTYIMFFYLIIVVISCFWGGL